MSRPSRASAIVILIVVERAMYWPNIAQGWREAHNSFGVTASSLRWGVADGRIGGARAFQTFILLANPNAFPAEVQVLNYQPIAVEKALYWNAGAEVFAGGTNVTATRLPPP